MKYKIRQVSVLQRHRPHEQRLFLSSNPQGHSVVVFNCYPRHAAISPYVFKWYIKIQVAVSLNSCTFLGLQDIFEATLSFWRLR
jgi:hypothetical protein